MSEPEVISSYSQQQAVDDGVLAEIFKPRWKELTGGRPLYATCGVVGAFSLAAIMEIWNAYAQAPRELRKTGQVYKTKMNDQEVWVIYDGAVFTILFPSDY